VFLLGWGLFWSMFAITVIIPHFNQAHVYRYWGAAGGHVAGIDTSWPVKLTTVVMLLLPTAFIALGSPVALLVIPSLVLRFISTDASFWGTGWHYNATVMPILFIAAAEAIGRWRRAAPPALAPGAPDPPPSPARPAPVAAVRALASRWPGQLRELARYARTGGARHGGAMMAAIAVALVFQFPLSNLWHGATYTINPHVAAADAAANAVPSGVTVTTTTDLLASLAARTDTFWIENPGNPATQYVVIDGAAYPPLTNIPAMVASMYKGERYLQVFTRDDVYVFRRG
jgi:uncharacterized membrane protein